MTNIVVGFRCFLFFCSLLILAFCVVFLFLYMCIFVSSVRFHFLDAVIAVVSGGERVLPRWTI